MTKAKATPKDAPVVAPEVATPVTPEFTRQEVSTSDEVTAIFGVQRVKS